MRRPPPLGPTLAEYLARRPGRLELTVEVDGDQHDTEGACACADTCRDCGGREHYQALYGGCWRECDRCALARPEWQHRRGLVVPGGGRVYLDAPRRADEWHGEIVC